MTHLEIHYRGVLVPGQYTNNLGSVEFKHFTNGVDAALKNGDTEPEPEVKYYQAVPSSGQVVLYRVVGGSAEAFQYGRWSAGNTSLGTLPEIRSLWGDALSEITADQLPEAAR